MSVGGFTYKRALPKTEKGVVLVDEITDGVFFNFRVGTPICSVANVPSGARA